MEAQAVMSVPDARVEREISGGRAGEGEEGGTEDVHDGNAGDDHDDDDVAYQAREEPRRVLNSEGKVEKATHIGNILSMARTGLRPSYCW